MRPGNSPGRGLAYWTDGREARILYVTPGYQLVALDAKTGAVVSSFGVNGIVDLKKDDDQEIDLITGEVGLHSTPVVAKNVVIVGAAHRSGGVPRGRSNVKGYVRGFDVRTGKRLWIFHTIPSPGEFGNDSWEKDSWTYTGNAGVWAQISVDEELGIAYLPVELPTGDYYGGHRPGNGLFGESLVAVDLQTGVRKWHFQFVHHGLWDMDLPCAPILADISVNGRIVKVVAQPTKQAWLYVFDRITGKPIWPIEERPVAKGDVPNEWYAPTQPFVTKPPAYDRQGVSIDDLIDFTPELRAEAIKQVAKYKIGPIFTPPTVSRVDGPLGTLVLPSATGGTNWPGGSYDPETHTLFVYSQTNVSSLGLLPPPDIKVSDMNFVQGSATAGVRSSGGSGAGAGADAAPAAPAAPAAAEGGGAGVTVQRATAHQAAVRPHHRDRSRHRHHQVADRPRRDTRQREEQSGTQGPDDSSDGAGRHHRHADDEVVDHRGREPRDDDLDRCERGDAARLRQGGRKRSRRGLHAGPAKRLADDLPAQRQAVPHRRDQRRELQRGTGRVQASGVTLVRRPIGVPLITMQPCAG